MPWYSDNFNLQMHSLREFSFQFKKLEFISNDIKIFELSLDIDYFKC